MASPLGSLLLIACGDSVAGLTVAGSTSSGESTSVSAGQTSAPEPTSEISGAPTTGAPDSTTASEATSTTADTSTGEPVGCPEIVIPDPGLLTHLLDELDLEAAPIPPALALATTSLTLVREPEIDSLAGLECFANLESLLIIGPGGISDLGPLSGLGKLESLELTLQDVGDLGPLVDLPLRRLGLAGSDIVDLATIAALPDLEYLDVENNPVVSFAPLADHPRLTRLIAAGTTPVDLAGLGEIPNLDELTLSGAGVTDLGPLAGAVGLTELGLSGNDIVELGPLAGMTQLERLELDSNQIATIDVLAGMPKLVTLRLRNNAIADVAPIAGHTGLRTLDLAKNALTSVAPLAGLLELRSLHLEVNQISDLAPLAALSALTELDVSDNPLVNGLSGLDALSELTDLGLEHTGTTSLVTISPATLRTLRAGGNAITDLAPLAGHMKLRALMLADNELTTIDPILAAPFWADDCVEIDLRGNPLDAGSLTTSLPGLCDDNHWVLWDEDECYYCMLR